MTYHYVYDAVIGDTTSVVPLCIGMHMSYLMHPIIYSNEATITKNTCKDCIRMNEILMCVRSRNEQ